MNLPGNSSATVACYRDAAVAQAFRLAALLDRNPHSRTRGSFSRTHWAWKFSDFPYPRLQEGLYALVQLHEIESPDNPMFQAPAVKDWARWAFEYWVSRQHPNGAYDEAYPFEQCVAATAFTGFYVANAYESARAWLDPALDTRVRNALVKAGDWLCRNDETHGVLSNHLAAAAAALESSARVLELPRFSTRAAFFRDRILQHQSGEGWMSEYGGADAGYGSLTVFYLASYWQRTGCRRTLEALDRFAEFLQFFVHPDGTFGGEYGSRDTEFYYPAGFEMLSAVSPAAAAIAGVMRESIARRQACGVWTMDEFNLMPMLNNMLFACRAARSSLAHGRLPFQQEPFRRYFPEAGLWVVNEPAYYAIAGVSKGGTVSVFDKATGRLTARHSGLVVRRDGRCFTSQDFRLSPPAEVLEGGAAIRTAASWKSMMTKVMTPWLFVGFRLFSLTAARMPAISRWLKHTLVAVLILKKRQLGVTHERTLRAGKTGISIVDELQLPWDAGSIGPMTQFTSIHMGSGLYADARTAVLEPLGPTWPVTRRMTLRAELTTSGATWSATAN